MKFIKPSLKSNFIILIFSLSQVVVLRRICGGGDVIEWDLLETKCPLEDYNTNNLQLRSPACNLESYKIKFADFLHSDVELVLLQ